MLNPNRFVFNQPFVVSELIDDEAVIMNLKSGNYYSTRHTGALVWAWLELGLALTEMASNLAGIYGGKDSNYAADLSSFIDDLRNQELIVPANSGSVTDPVHADRPTNHPTAYTPPMLEIYSDMQDLLLLDPIHDIDEVGWPVAKPTRPASI